MGLRVNRHFEGKKKKASNPDRTVRADIRLDIRKITDVRVELSVQQRISVVHRAPKCVAPISAWISSWISVLRISEREVYYVRGVAIK